MKTEKVVTITDNEFFYNAGYFVTNKWIDEETFIGVRSKEECDGAKSELVKISLEKKSIEVIATDVRSPGFANVTKDKVYYNNSKGVAEFDLKTNKQSLICETDAYALQMTNDSKYASVFAGKKDEPTKFYRINTETGEVEFLFEKMFEKPLNVANHFMISPTDKDLFFFAHEGSTFYVSNRLWLYDAKSKSMWNIAKQRLDQDGNLSDCFGHEMWAPDGKGLYFVKYPCSPEPPRGICYVDIRTGKYELLYSKYNYWHVGVSSGGRFLLADTLYLPYQSQVVVIDTLTGEEFVADTPHIIGVHPCHPHPQMSPDNKKIIYTALDKKDGRTCIKVAYLSD